MKYHSLQTVSFYTKVGILALIVAGGLQFVNSWTGPSSAAPGGNVIGALTVGAGNQTKINGDISLAGGGSLYVGGIVAGNSMSAGTDVTSPAIIANEICLNGVCVTKWPWK